MRIKYDIAGKRFGRLLVVEPSKSRAGTWDCVCDCGYSGTFFSGNLRNGVSKSCGCLRTEVTVKRSTTHGATKTPTWWSWTAMRGRCLITSHVSYKNYGGRGIKICDRWMKFDNFLADMGQRPEGMSIERKDNDGDYEPSNCRWADDNEQAHNKRNNVFDVETVKAIRSAPDSVRNSELARTFGVPRSYVYQVRTGAAWAVV